MALSASIAITPYSECCRCLQQSAVRCQSVCNRLAILRSPALPQLSLRCSNHTGYLKAALYPSVVCGRIFKTTAVTWESWDKLVLKNNSPVLVEFYASWCGPCQMVHRVIDEIATEYQGKLECFMVDTDKDLMVAEEYDVKAVPVVMLFKNGKKREYIVGTMPKEFYLDAVERLLTL
ncbi:hypothetical protein Cgig2_032500 [Carnegiea gigantea]|uniref:Thioredoxin domain-containing protein n=1 Tax=Carnegiea gigantea TaxID=171969 RepID=A0A9Q1KVY0_9CARY|nr:hypothetical protein Cgig2_032500 [Carnegiea gigantea]